jgi:alkanesulfonate monooxygenase SsuD/methylene tetrahydromethanopterin reductase-like flavin-dependent oxidoreductase (luciferase family)
VFLGIAAGGAEVSGAAGVSRRDAPERIRALIALLRGVVDGAPLDATSGRRLEVPLRPVPVLVAGRGNGVLDAAGRAADRALLWAVPRSDLRRSLGVIEAGARAAQRSMPEVVWAPLVDHGGDSRARVRTIAAYSVLNSNAVLHARWGLDAAAMEQLRQRLVGGGAAAAADLVPRAALDDLILADPDPAQVGSLARELGATSLALPAFAIGELAERVAWARQVLG